MHEYFLPTSGPGTAGVKVPTCTRIDVGLMLKSNEQKCRSTVNMVYEEETQLRRYNAAYSNEQLPYAECSESISSDSATCMVQVFVRSLYRRL